MPAEAPGSIISPAWYARPVADVVRDLDADPADGLSSAEAQRRLDRYGRNQLAEAPKEPRWRAFVRQFQDLLIVILLVAAVVSLLVSREWETPVAIALVVLLNATIGFVQESKAEASLDALRRMSVTTARVRRDARTSQVDARDVVPGDVVLMEAGDRFRRTVGSYRRRRWRSRSPCSPVRRSRRASRRRPRSARTPRSATGRTPST
jgi:Ca2+-transporting ATPase